MQVPAQPLQGQPLQGQPLQGQPPQGQPVARTRLTLPRLARVTRKSDFDRAWRHGSRARGEILLVVAVPNELGVARVGLSVGKKVWKHAVDRNRVRRIFREAFRLERHGLPPGHDFVLVSAAPKLEPELAATRAELARLAKKAVARLRGGERPREKAP